MGISGLLGSLKSIQQPSHLSDFRGKTVAIDAYGWLHRGAIACALELVTGRPTRRYVDFAMHRVRMLLHFGLTPYVVFDGDHLPSKAATEADRRTRREDSKTYALELQRLERKAQAYQESQKAVDVTPEMARFLIEELKRDGIQYVVAPYEADSQMVYLERKGLVDAIISEDSDLLVFGSQCLITKLDQYGECMVIRRTRFASCLEMNLTNWTDAEFRCMAILSGCDYLDGIPRMGIKTAHRLVRKHKTIDRIIRGAQWESKFKVPPDYLQSYDQANKTFLHQWVYCPVEQCLVHFTPPSSDTDPTTMTYIGEFVRDEISRKVANGDLHPMTKEALKLPANAPGDPRGRLPAHSTKTAQLEAASKGNKSITEFIRPKRTPLAELDPNTLHLSDHQQGVLQAPNNGRPWPSDPAPSHAPMTASMQAPSRRPLQTAHSSVTTQAREAKRQRFCAEDPDSPSKRGNTSLSLESPFFTKSITAAPGAEKGRVHAKRRRKSMDFQLWSDDSLDGIKQPVEQSQEVSRPVTKHKRLAVFMDDSGTEARPSLDVSKWSLPDEIDSKRAVSVSSALRHPPCAAVAKAHTQAPSQTNDSVSDAADTNGTMPRPLSSQTVVSESPPSQGHTTKAAFANIGTSSRSEPLLGTLSRVCFKGSEDALVPESDIGSMDESKSPGRDSSEASEPPTPTGEQVARRRRHILRLEDFIYAGDGHIAGA